MGCKTLVSLDFMRRLSPPARIMAILSPTANSRDKPKNTLQSRPNKKHPEIVATGSLYSWRTPQHEKKTTSKGVFSIEAAPGHFCCTFANKKGLGIIPTSEPRRAEIVTTQPGLEPGLTGPKPVVLPITPLGMGCCAQYFRGINPQLPNQDSNLD